MQEEIEKEEIEEVEVEIEPFEKNEVYRTDKFKKMMIDTYNEYTNYSYTAKILNKEFGTKITDGHVKNLYLKQTAAVIMKSKKTNELFNDNFEALQKRWKKAEEILDWLTETALDLKKEMSKSDDPKGKALLIMKLAPQLIQISREIQNQLEFLTKQNAEIKATQNNYYFSNSQINDEISKRLKSWVRQGYIKIIQNMPDFDKKFKE